MCMHNYTCTEVILAKLLLCYLFTNMVFNNSFYPHDASQKWLAEMQAFHQNKFPAEVKMRHLQQYLPLLKHEVRFTEQRMLPPVLAQWVHQWNSSEGVSQPTSLLKIRWVAGCWWHRTCQLLCKPFWMLCLAEPLCHCNPAMLKWRQVRALPETMFLVSY